MVGRTNNEMELKVKNKLGKVNNEKQDTKINRRLKIPKSLQTLVGKWNTKIVTLLAVPLIMYQLSWQRSIF